MHQTSTNITPKYHQETHYNYAKNSGFFASNCSPLLCYRFVTTALTAQIPAETLSQTHRVCFIGKERDSETGFSYFGARYYDSDLMTGWLSVDPLADKYPNQSNYIYCSNNPIRIIDPNGMDEWELNTENGNFKRIGNKGGSEKDYYNVGTYNDEDKFEIQSTHCIERANNINSFRIKETENSTISAFHIPNAETDEISSGFFLERSGPDCDESNMSKRIPSGSYSLTKHSGKTYKNVPKLYKKSEGLLGKFANRFILIHSGNRYTETIGCLLAGSSMRKEKGDYIVENSRNTVAKIVNYCNNRKWDDLKINIINVIK